MRDRFLELYNQELRHFRDMAGEFGTRYPEVAGALTGRENGADPFVERLLEGVAFLAARVQLKQEAVFPQFTSHLLDCAFPHWGKPTPSMGVVEFVPDNTATGINDGFVIPPRSRLFSRPVPGIELPCEFVTAHPVRLLPIRVTAARYVSGPSGDNIPVSCQAFVEIDLASFEGADIQRIDLSELEFYIDGDDDTASFLYEQLVSNCTGVALRFGGKSDSDSPFTMLPPTALSFRSCDAERALMPLDSRIFSGFRLLQEYFALPQRYRYFVLSGDALKRAFRQHARGTRFSVRFFFDVRQSVLASVVGVNTFRLFTTPVINLFSRRMDRIIVEREQTEHHIVPDRRNPLAYEVYEVQGMEAYDEQNIKMLRLAPLFSGADLRKWQDATAYYTVRREPRIVHANKVLSSFASNYNYCDAFASIVDRHNAPMASGVRQLGGALLVSNGGFAALCPKGERHDLTLKDSAPLESARFLVGPTEPAPATPYGETPWRLINLLSLNYLYLHETDPAGAVSALQNLLSEHAQFGRNRHLAHAKSLRSVGARVVTRRYPAPGPITYARGIELALTFDDRAFSGSSPSVFGHVLSRFMQQFVQMNSFVEVAIHTEQRGLTKRWPPQIGQRGMA